MSHLASLNLLDDIVWERTRLASSPVPQSLFPCPFPLVNSLSSHRLTLTWSRLQKNPSRIRATSPNADTILKLMASFEKHLILKKQLQGEVEEELKKVKDIVKHDHALRIFVKLIGMNVPYSFPRGSIRAVIGCDRCELRGIFPCRKVVFLISSYFLFDSPHSTTCLGVVSKQ